MDSSDVDRLDERAATLAPSSDPEISDQEKSADQDHSSKELGTARVDLRSRDARGQMEMVQNEFAHPHRRASPDGAGGADNGLNEHFAVRPAHELTSRGRETRASLDSGRNLNDHSREFAAESLIRNADDAFRACRQVKALADAVQSFVEQLTAAEKVRRSVPRIRAVTRTLRSAAADFVELRSTLATIASIIDDTKDLGVNSLGDLERLMAAERGLPHDVPPGQLIETLREVDGVRFSVLLGQAKRIQKLQEELTAGPDLTSVLTESLARACEIAAAAIKTDYFLLSPAQCFAEATKRKRDARALIQIIENGVGALNIIGYDRSYPAQGLEAIALAAIVAARLPPPYRKYLKWSSSGGVDVFQRAYDRWSELVSIEAGWKSRLPGYLPNCRPSIEDLELAVTHFVAHPLYKRRAEMTGAGKSARALVTQLGFDLRDSRIKEDLESLVAHLRAVRRFCNNATYREMFGSAWAGLETPFEEFAAAMLTIQKIRGFFNDVVRGSRVFERLILLEPDQLEALGALATLSGELHNLPPEQRARLDSRTIDELVSELESELALADRILNADPERQTAAIEVSLSQLQVFGGREIERRDLASSIERDPLSPMVSTFACDNEIVDVALETISYVSAVRKTDLASELRSQLTSEGARQAREQLRDVCHRAAIVLRILDDQLVTAQELQGRRGPTTSSRTDLLKQIDGVIALKDEFPGLLGRSIEKIV